MIDGGKNGSFLVGLMLGAAIFFGLIFLLISGGWKVGSVAVGAGAALAAVTSIIVGFVAAVFQEMGNVPPFSNWDAGCFALGLYTGLLPLLILINGAFGWALGLLAAMVAEKLGLPSYESCGVNPF